MATIDVKDATGTTRTIEIPDDPTENAQLDQLLAALASTAGTDELRTLLTGALPAGGNNIGDVDVATTPVSDLLNALSANSGTADADTLRAVLTSALPAGNNNIGSVDVAATPLSDLLAALASNATDTLRVEVTGEPSPPGAIYAGQKAVSIAGTPEALAAAQALDEGVTVKAKSSNSGNVYVQPSGAGAGAGYILAGGESVELGVADLSTVYLDVDIEQEAVSYVAS